MQCARLGQKKIKILYHHEVYIGAEALECNIRGKFFLGLAHIRVQHFAIHKFMLIYHGEMLHFNVCKPPISVALQVSAPYTTL